MPLTTTEVRSRLRRLARRAAYLWLALAAACSGAPEGARPAGAEAGADARSAGLERRPNVLLLIVDDLRPTLGCYGDSLARTPRIDALAAESLVFDRAYCQQALCSPSRSSMLTGRRPNTTGVFGLGKHFRVELPDVVTLPQRFRLAGYQTRAFGKVHHGDGDLDDLPSWSVPPWRPAELIHYYTPESKAMQAAQEEYMREHGYSEPARGPATEVAPVSGEVLVDGLIASEAIRVMEEVHDEPFFLAVGFRKPHLPFVAPKDCFDRYDPDAFPLPERRELPQGTPAFVGSEGGELRASPDIPLEGPLSDELTRHLIHAYYACVSHVDDQIGRVLDALDRLELREDTIVVLWSDHGYQLGELGQWCKHTNFEQAVRAPFFVRLPREASLPAGLDEARARGRHTRALVEFVDLYPTLTELCGLELDPGLEGLSLVPLFTRPQADWKLAAFSQYPRTIPELQRRGMGFSMRTDRYRLTTWRSGEETVATELYDYVSDPRSERNLAEDPAYAERRAELERELGLNWRGALPPAPPAPEASRN